MTKSNLFLKCGRKGVGRDQSEHACQRLFGMPEVVLLLSFEPEVRCGAREPSQTRSHLGTDRGRAGEHAMERLTRDAKLAGGLADREAKAGQNLVTQDPSRMRRSHGARLSGAGHTGTLVKPTVALWATGRRKQGLLQI